MNNQEIKALLFMPYAKARVVIEGATISLYSYNTKVAQLNRFNGWLVINGLYNMTTRRHLSAFCREYCKINNFNLIKYIANNLEKYNIRTGEAVYL